MLLFFNGSTEGAFQLSILMGHDELSSVFFFKTCNRPQRIAIPSRFIFGRNFWDLWNVWRLKLWNLLRSAETSIFRTRLIIVNEFISILAVTFNWILFNSFKFSKRSFKPNNWNSQSKMRMN